MVLIDDLMRTKLVRVYQVVTPNLPVTFQCLAVSSKLSCSLASERIFTPLIPRAQHRPALLEKYTFECYLPESISFSTTGKWRDVFSISQGKNSARNALPFSVAKLVISPQSRELV